MSKYHASETVLVTLAGETKAATIIETKCSNPKIGFQLGVLYRISAEGFDEHRNTYGDLWVLERECEDIP